MNGKYNSLITAKNVGIVTILCAATATIIILGQPSSKRKLKKKKQNKLQIQLSAHEIECMKHDLESRRQKILNEFEQSNHKKIPAEMDSAMDYIVNDISRPELYPATIRLLASQLIQDYAIMYTNINNCEPSHKIISLAKEWLSFKCKQNISLQIEQINHRYALALRSKSIKEFKLLYEWLQWLKNESVSKNIINKESIKQNWILRNFQCCCLLGKWDKVLQYGKQLENIKPESLSVQSNNNNNSASNVNTTTPLHPLHLFEYIALKLPNQSANFTQVYYNVNKYINKFDPMLSPPLRFTEWQIKNCKTVITFAFSTNPKRNEELAQQIKKASETSYSSYPQSNAQSNNPNQFMFVYGCLVQFPCFWVQLPASNTKMQPVVLTGPYNDSEMELTASYIRRVPHQQNDNDNNKDKKNIRVVRSDLRLKLDRGKPFDFGNNESNVNDEKQSDDEIANSNHKKSKKWNGWNWHGTFEHEEGLLECSESDLNDFQFRRTLNWKPNAIKFTCRSWNCHMVISTPD